MILYVAGPMTGKPDKNRLAFAEAESNLVAFGHTVLTPWSVEGDGSQTWEWYMREALKLMLQAEGVALLDDWQESRGALLEVTVADTLNMPIRGVGGWLR